MLFRKKSKPRELRLSVTPVEWEKMDKDMIREVSRTSAWKTLWAHLLYVLAHHLVSGMSNEKREGFLMCMCAINNLPVVLENEPEDDDEEEETSMWVMEEEGSGPA